MARRTTEYYGIRSRKRYCLEASSRKSKKIVRLYRMAT